MTKFRPTALLVVLWLLVGCQDMPSHDQIDTENEAIETANAYLSNMQFSLDANYIEEIEAIDMGDRWRLAYKRPEGSTGGPVIVVVNKRRGEVVHMETQQ
jgi:hypothetical protein